jgi:hypothetical protein
MRVLAATVLTLAIASPAGAGPIRVGIDVGDAELRDPFLVSVTGHYADLHNGYSRRWKDALVRAGGRHWIGLGPVNLLLNMGVSVSLYHPEYVAVRERSNKTPLLIRPVRLDTFRPRSWREMLQSSDEFANGGPAQLLGQLVGHFQMFLLYYLPTIDAAEGELAARDASLREYLPLFHELVAFAATEAAAQPRGYWARKLETDPSFATSLASSAFEQRAELRELRRRIDEWLSLSRAQRVEVRDLMEGMRYGKTVGEQLMMPGDLAQVGAFLERQREDREARREPEGASSWTNPENRVTYRVSLLGTPRQCSRLSITVDLTRVVDADLGEMVKAVKARFCQLASGEWRYEKS